MPALGLRLEVHAMGMYRSVPEKNITYMAELFTPGSVLTHCDHPLVAMRVLYVNMHVP